MIHRLRQGVKARRERRALNRATAHMSPAMLRDIGLEPTHAPGRTVFGPGLLYCAAPR